MIEVIINHIMVAYYCRLAIIAYEATYYSLDTVLLCHSVAHGCSCLDSWIKVTTPSDCCRLWEKIVSDICIR